MARHAPLFFTLQRIMSNNQNRKELTAPFISAIEMLSNEEVVTTLRSTEPHAIACINWSDYPYAPEVTLHIAHSERALALMFEVKEQNTKAVTLEDNGPVWEDSCVEFFVRDPRGEGYFNFELNCVGTLLAANRRSRTDANMFSAEKLASVRRFGSLPHERIDCRDGEWWIVEIIPFSLLGLEEAPEEISANFYKCGDKCEPMHFLSWSPIALPSPDFHCPDFFGTVKLSGKSEA